MPVQGVPVWICSCGQPACWRPFGLPSASGQSLPDAGGSGIAALVHRLQIRPRVLHLIQDAVGIFEQMLPGGREPGLAAKAVKETALQFPLQRFDGMADRRLREEQFAGGLRKAATACQRGKREQLATVENGFS